MVRVKHRGLRFPRPNDIYIIITTASPIKGGARCWPFRLIYAEGNGEKNAQTGRRLRRWMLSINNARAWRVDGRLKDNAVASETGRSATTIRPSVRPSDFLVSSVEEKRARLTEFIIEVARWACWRMVLVTARVFPGWMVGWFGGPKSLASSIDSVRDPTHLYTSSGWRLTVNGPPCQFF